MVGGWGEIKIKAKLSPVEAGVWAELGNKAKELIGLKTQGDRRFLSTVYNTALVLINLVKFSFKPVLVFFTEF